MASCMCWVSGQNKLFMLKRWVLLELAQIGSRHVIFPGTAVGQDIEADKASSPAVNNVGTNISKPSADFSEEEYDKIQNTNLKSTFRACQLAYPMLKAAQNSCIVMIGSVAGGPASIKSGTIYGMTKGE